MDQNKWLVSLELECNERISIYDGLRNILQNELVISLHSDVKNLKELSKAWLLELSEKAKAIRKYCKDDEIPIIVTDTGNGIDIHFFFSNLKEVQKKFSNTSQQEIKMKIGKIIVVRSKLEQNTIIEVRSEGKVLAIGSQNKVTKSCKTVVTKLTEKKYISQKDVRYPNQITKWHIPEESVRELKKMLDKPGEPKSIEYDLTIVGECYDFLDHKEETEVRLINPNKVGDVQIFFIHSKEELFDIIKKWVGKGYNFYFGINERKKGGTKGIDVKSVKTIVIDIDASRIYSSLTESERKKQPANREELQLASFIADTIIKKEFIEKGFKKPIKCMSGNGFQLWVSIPEIKITDANRDEINDKIQNFNRYLREKYSDKEYATIDNIGDLARIIKIIGTKSVKGKEEHHRPHRLSYSEQQFIRDEDPKLRDYILSMQVEKELEKTIVESKQLTIEDVKAAEKSLKERYKKDPKLKKLLSGSTEGFESRSEAEASAVSKLIFYGLSKAEIFHIMDSSDCSKWKEAPKSYRESTYKNSKEYVKKRLLKQLDSLD